MVFPDVPVMFVQINNRFRGDLMIARFFRFWLNRAVSTKINLINQASRKQILQRSFLEQAVVEQISLFLHKYLLVHLVQNIVYRGGCAGDSALFYLVVDL